MGKDGKFSMCMTLHLESSMNLSRKKIPVTFVDVEDDQNCRKANGWSFWAGVSDRKYVLLRGTTGYLQVPVDGKNHRDQFDNKNGRADKIRLSISIWIGSETKKGN